MSVPERDETRLAKLVRSMEWRSLGEDASKRLELSCGIVQSWVRELVDLSRKIVTVDDVMQLSVDLIRQVKKCEVNVTVKIADVVTNPDGSKQLLVERIGSAPVDVLPVDIHSNQFKNFEDAFQTPSAGAIRTCVCGRVFYNPDGGWSFEDGELERLKSIGATSVPWACQEIEFEGDTYAMDCDCWKRRAAKIAAWIDEHAVSIAEYLTLEKQRKYKEADVAPVVR